MSGSALTEAGAVDNVISEEQTSCSEFEQKLEVEHTDPCFIPDKSVTIELQNTGHDSMVRLDENSPVPLWILIIFHLLVIFTAVVLSYKYIWSLRNGWYLFKDFSS